MRRRCRCEEVGQQAFVVAFQVEILLEAYRRGPVPQEAVVRIRCEPVPFHAAPEGVDAGRERLLRRRSVFQILAGAEESGRQERGFDDVGPVVFAVRSGKGDGLARAVVDPMGVHAVPAFGAFQKRYDLFQPSDALRTGDEVPFDADQYSHDPEAPGTDRQRVFVFRRFVREVADPRQSRVGTGAAPHIFEVGLLNPGQQPFHVLPVFRGCNRRGVVTLPWTLFTFVRSGAAGKERRCGEQPYRKSFHALNCRV